MGQRLKRGGAALKAMGLDLKGRKLPVPMALGSLPEMSGFGRMRSVRKGQWARPVRSTEDRACPR